MLSRSWHYFAFSGEAAAGSASGHMPIQGPRPRMRQNPFWFGDIEQIFRTLILPNLFHWTRSNYCDSTKRDFWI